MKTAIDIPEALYRRAKIQAAETGRTLKEIVLVSLEKELTHSISVPQKSFWERRKLHPGCAAALKAGAYLGGTDSTTMVSEDRTSRDNALL